MPWIYELNFQPSGEVKKVMTPFGYYYVLPDGRTVAMAHRFVWCFGCNNFSWAEALPFIEEVAHRIQIWEDLNSEERKTKLQEQKFPDQKQWTVDRELGSAYAYRDLLLARTEPCQCRKCGNVEFIEVLEGTEFTLPDGSGTVMMHCVAHASVGGIATYYTPNGQSMLPEDVPPAPFEAAYPSHHEKWKDHLFQLVLVMTIPIWGPIAFLVLAVIGICKSWDFLRRHWIAKTTRS